MNRRAIKKSLLLSRYGAKASKEYKTMVDKFFKEDRELLGY